jgi:serine-type D-Ala-D-Ala endopeptidase (penicillin-binding protein 7)
VGLNRLWAGVLALACVAVFAAGSSSALANSGSAQGNTKAPSKAAPKAAPKSKPSEASRAGRAQAQKSGVARKGETARPGQRKRVVRAAPPRPTYGMRAGLHAVDDPLDLKSSVALVVDQDTQEVLVSKNPDAVLPIASITKLMTAMVVTEANLPLDEEITISADDVAAYRSRSSRLSAGTRLTRGELLHLALMASENRAAHALCRAYPVGMSRFVEAMNAKADLLGMHDTRYVEPTGLSSDNRSSAQDLAKLVRAAADHAVIRDYSTALEADMAVGRKQVQFRNTNGLMRNPAWEILLQKTGFISEAGRCVVMQAQLAGRRLIMVLLDSTGKSARIGDAERIRSFIASRASADASLVAPAPGITAVR